MTEVWVLLVVMGSGIYGRPALTSHEFLSRSACEEAAAWVAANTWEKQRTACFQSSVRKEIAP